MLYRTSIHTANYTTREKYFADNGNNKRNRNRSSTIQIHVYYICTEPGQGGQTMYSEELIEIR